MALNPISIAALQQSQPIVQDKEGRPTAWFIRALNSAFQQIAAAVNAVIASQNAADAAQAAADAAAGNAGSAQGSAAAAQSTANTALANAATAQGRADDAYTLADNAVVKLQTPAPVYVPYTGQTVSNPPTQAEMQALDNAVVALATAYDSLKNKLQAIEALS